LKIHKVGIPSFQPKIFRLKTSKLESLDSWESENYVSRTKPPKIFASKLEKIRCVWDSEFYVSRTKPPKIFRLKLEKFKQKCPI